MIDGKPTPRTGQSLRVVPTLSRTAQRRALALVPAALVVFVGAIAYDRARTLVRDVGEVERSHAVIERADELLTRAVDAETGQRAYLLVGDEVFLDPFRGARQDIARSIDSLRRLVRGEVGQEPRLDSISAIMGERFAVLDSGIVAFRRGDVADARNHERLMRGKVKMDRLRGFVAALQLHEKKLLAERHAVERRSVRNASIVVASAAIIAIALSALVNLAFSRAIKERDTANQQLKEVKRRSGATIPAARDAGGGDGIPGRRAGSDR